MGKLQEEPVWKVYVGVVGEGMAISSFEYLKFGSITHSRGWHLDVSVMFREDT